METLKYILGEILIVLMGTIVCIAIIAPFAYLLARYG